MTMWEKYKRYINKRSIGDVIFRKDILPYLYGDQNIPKSTYGTGGDNYRRCLEKAGILERVGRGQYKILHHIKDDVTSSLIKELAYVQNWKEWFINIKVEETI